MLDKMLDKLISPEPSHTHRTRATVLPRRNDDTTTQERNPDRDHLRFDRSAEFVTKIMGENKKIKLAQQSDRPCESLIDRIVEGDEA